jgi:D-sedoheptulose 7-phosphate isomerase
VSDFTSKYFESAAEVIKLIDLKSIDDLVALLVKTRSQEGRLFVLGVGGSAANASHAVNDFRKLAGIEAYAPTDNVSELTARVNDEGWQTVFEAWLRVSHLKSKDMVLVFSVGGGSLEKNISPNLVTALRFAKEVGAMIGGIVGRDGGYTAQVADACVIIPTIDVQLVTPLTEAFQAVVWHLIVSHPDLKLNEGKWESAR